MKWFGALVLLAGCPPPVTYGYQYRLTQQFDTGGEVPEPAPHEARELLASAKTVAFYPPDICLNADASETRTKELKANCGVLLSTLERAAERAGYEVLSWQNLKGNKRPIDFAREANVDVLFEINEFDLGALDDSTVQRTLTFYKEDGVAETPAMVSNLTAQRCRDYANQRDPAQMVALSGAIDIKTVAVADGRDRWHYRKTLAQSLGRVYPKVTFTRPGKTPPLSRALWVLGGLAADGAFTFFLLENLISDDPSTPKNETPDFAPWDYVLALTAIGAFAGAIYNNTHNAAGAPPDEVLCDPTLAVAPMMVPIVPGPMSAQHTFTEQTGGDVAAKQKEQIRNAMIADFIGVLSEVHGAKH